MEDRRDSNRTTDDERQPQPSTTLSKRQQKRLLKDELWQSTRKERRERYSRRRKERRAEKRANGVDLGPSRKRLRLTTMQNSGCKLRCVIDMSFDDLMTERDSKKAVKQIQQCYAINRRSQHPLQFYVTNFDGPSRRMLDAKAGAANWDGTCVFFKSEDYQQLFDKESLVYLTSDSPNVLETLDDAKVYVIGGLVDHNHHKRHCLTVAEGKGLAHAQLPIEQYLELKSRKILTINQVFEILLRFTELGDWEKAFFAAIPKRKFAQVDANNDD